MIYSHGSYKNNLHLFWMPNLKFKFWTDSIVYAKTKSNLATVQSSLDLLSHQVLVVKLLGCYCLSNRTEHSQFKNRAIGRSENRGGGPGGLGGTTPCPLRLRQPWKIMHWPEASCWIDPLKMTKRTRLLLQCSAFWRGSEKGEKFEKIFHFQFEITQYRQILSGRFFQILCL